MAGYQSITRIVSAALSCSSISGAAFAHPHEDIEQQVLLSLGQASVTIQIRIVPSYTDGAAIFAHIDLDGDGSVSTSEAQDFGASMIRESALSVDDQKFVFGAPAVVVPEREWVVSGFGVIEVDATVAVNLASRAPHRVDFSISYDALAHDWFIQPFFFPELLRALPEMSFERGPSGDSVAISLRP